MTRMVAPGIGMGIRHTGRGAARPIVTSVNFDQGDPLGGGLSIVAAGSFLADAIAARFGATSATITGNTASELTCTLPVHLAGAVDFTIETAGGTSVAVPFEYWALDTEASCTVLAEKPDYDEAGGDGTWVVRKGVNLTKIVGAPTDAGGYPHYGGVARLASTANMAAIFDMSSDAAAKGTFVAGVDMVAASGYSGIDSKGFFGDFGRGALGAAYANAGGEDRFYGIVLAGGYKESHVACSLATLHHVCMRFAANGNLETFCDATVGTVTALTDHSSSGAPTLAIGSNYDVSYINGAMLYVATYNVAISDAIKTKARKWAQQRHAAP